MADQTRTEKADHAATMVAALQSSLTSGAGVVSVTIDGNTTTFDRASAMRELDYWEKRLLRFRRASNSRTTTIRLDGAS